MIMALTANDVRFWWLLLGVGGAVILVVLVLAALLSSLLNDADRTVTRMHAAVDEIGDSDTGAALNDAAAAAARLRLAAEGRGGGSER